MKKSKLIILVAAFGFAVLFSSCAKVPQTEVDAATAAVQKAKDAQTELYAPQAFQAVTDSLKKANEQIEVQKAKWFSNYTKSKALLAVVDQMASDDLVLVDKRKTELKTETAALLVEVKGLVEADKALVAKAPRGKEGKAALVAISSDITLVETSVTEVETLLANGDLIGSNDKIKAAKEKATAIKTELDTAIATVATAKTITKTSKVKTK
jgi:hypothetical protein